MRLRRANPMRYEWIEHNLSDEPQVVYQSVSCSLVFNFCFQYFRGITQRFPRGTVKGAVLLKKCFRVYWQPSGKVVRC